MTEPETPALTAETLLARLQAARAADAGTGVEVARIHEALAEDAAPDREVTGQAYASLGARLRLAFGEGRKREQQQVQAFRTDVHGHVRLVSTPPLRIASMSGRPWSAGPLRRLYAAFGIRRGQLASSDADADLKPDAPDPVGNWYVAGAIRRTILLALVLGQTWIATYYMTAVLPYHGGRWMEVLILVLYAILFAWVSAGFWTAMMGFLQLLMRRDPYSINGSAGADQPLDPTGRTAILMPIANEHVPRVMAGLRATYDSVARTGQLAQFDFFILSDTSDPETRVAELSAWLRLCREVDGFGRIFYRRRQHRIKRKSGNIADFCRRWGSNYRYMVILDADSVMSGACLVRLAQLMEANPGAGIIQTAPRAAGRETMYSRIQQFATRVYGPLFTAGLHFWQLGESHYWGHNAIIRVAPFIRNCSLPRLSGKGALSGEILSHDFVEAALMRRAGWSVWIAYDLPGSYEEMPPNLLDELKRDRRWCQGNLQNFRLFLTQGLHPAHRAVFMTGVMAYLSAPLWFVSLCLSTALIGLQSKVEPQYFSEPNQLFPTWPEWHPEWALALFSATATLLFLPKVLAVVLILFQGARNYGGGLMLFFSMMVELVFSALLAPVRMLFHTQFVVAGLLGIGIVWKSPPREDSATPWSEALRRHGAGTALGVAWAGLVYWLDPTFLWWLLPVVGSLMLAIPLSVWSSRARLGRWFRERRFFLIPEEAVPPRELRWTAAGLRRAGEPPGFVDAVVDPVINALVCTASVPRPKQSAELKAQRRALVEKALAEGPGPLDIYQRNTLLGDPIALSRLHFGVWTQPQAGARWLDGQPPQAHDPS